jgi:hypothetical protein
MSAEKRCAITDKTAAFKTSSNRMKPASTLSKSMRIMPSVPIHTVGIFSNATAIKALSDGNQSYGTPRLSNVCMGFGIGR